MSSQTVLVFGLIAGLLGLSLGIYITARKYNKTKSYLELEIEKAERELEYDLQGITKSELMKTESGQKLHLILLKEKSVSEDQLYPREDVINKPIAITPALKSEQLHNENRILLVLLLDTSGSMAGERIQLLNQSLLEFSDDLRKNEVVARRLDIAIIAFGSTVLVLPTESADRFYPPELVAEGTTSLGRAVSVSLDLIHEWKETQTSRGESFSKPLIILLTDGEPSDDWQHIAMQVRSQERRNELRFISVGIGDANMDILASFSRNEPPHKLTETGFRTVFQRASQSVTELAYAQI